MNGFVPGLSETLTWPRYGRHNVAIAVVTVVVLALFVASIGMGLSHSGLWWLLSVALVGLLRSHRLRDWHSGLHGTDRPRVLTRHKTAARKGRRFAFRTILDLHYRFFFLRLWRDAVCDKKFFKLFTLERLYFNKALCNRVKRSAVIHQHFACALTSLV